MMRLIKWLFILVLTVIAVVVGLLFSKDTIAKAAVEQQIRAQTGMDVKIGKFSLSVLSPLATIENLTLYNTADFGGTPFLNIRALHIQFDREALAHRELRLKLLKLDIAELAVVKNDLGQTNIVALAAAPKPTKTSEMVDFKGIDVANFSISKVAFVDLKNQKNNRQITLNLQNLVFRDLNTSGEFYEAFVQIWQNKVRK
jgi:uncharacterized protein involved in outer membrane biogenesis